MVSGGQGDIIGGVTGVTTLSSTEILINGSDSWIFVGELPRSLESVRAVSIDNTIILTGKM